ncbi:MAG TPA: hypothetical protein VFD43_00510 [Planctomycetota bacterium]|nr:hypothetical protein [Planctomycetota bacterium]
MRGSPTCLPLRLALAAFGSVLAPGALAQTHWTVDDDGPADFSSLATAVASPHVKKDDVLRIAPGTYAAFKTSKALRLISSGAAERPQIVGGETIFESSFGPIVLAGLQFEELRCGYMIEPLVIEDCVVGHVENLPWLPTWSDAASSYTFWLRGCDAVVSNVTAWGQKSASMSTPATAALALHDGYFAVVNGTLKGGPGGIENDCSAPGKSAIHVEGPAGVVVAGCSLKGGNGGLSSGLCGQQQNQSHGGSGLRVAQATPFFPGPSRAWVRGSSAHVLDPGEATGTGNDAASMDGSGEVVASGCTFELPLFGDSVAGTLAEPPEPYLLITHDGVPGGSARLELYGPAGATAAVAIGTAGAPSEPGHIVGGALWLQPASVVVTLHLTTLGQDVPAVRVFRLPESDSHAGTVAWAQAFFPVGDGTQLATNPATVVLRF